MAPHTLRYTSPAKAYRLTPPVVLYTGKVDLWTVSETIQEHSREDLAKKGLPSTTLFWRRKLRPSRIYWSLVARPAPLQRSWRRSRIYAAARPFNYLRSMIQFYEGPTGWAGNFKEVKQAIRKESQANLFADIRHTPRHWVVPPILPLETALKARTAYLTADPVLRDLIDLHVAAFMQLGQPRFFLLAKALEIAGAFYRSPAGTYTRAARNAGLQKLVTDAGLAGSLTQTVEWIFDIANRRREIRHAWDKDADDLHPPLTVQEGEDFVRNADLVVRVFVCTQLSLPVVSYQGQL